MSIFDTARNAFVLVAMERHKLYLAMGETSQAIYWLTRARAVCQGKCLMKSDVWSTDCFANVYTEMRLSLDMYDEVFDQLFE